MNCPLLNILNRTAHFRNWSFPSGIRVKKRITCWVWQKQLCSINRQSLSLSLYSTYDQELAISIRTQTQIVREYYMINRLQNQVTWRAEYHPQNPLQLNDFECLKPLLCVTSKLTHKFFFEQFILLWQRFQKQISLQSIDVVKR